MEQKKRRITEDAAASGEARRGVDMICVENVTYSYPQRAEPVISAFSACIRRGEIVALRGKNGSGKTTLTKLIAGILRPSAGGVSIDGHDTACMDLFDIGRRAGYVFQNPNRQLFCETAYDEVAFGLRNLGFGEDEVRRRTGTYLERFGLSRYSDVYPRKLSLGERQRLALAAVLALGTGYLILDEPTTGLDAPNRGELGGLLEQLRDDSNCGILLVSHEAGFTARYADRDLVMPG